MEINYKPGDDVVCIKAVRAPPGEWTPTVGEVYRCTDTITGPGCPLCGSTVGAEINAEPDTYWCGATFTKVQDIDVGEWLKANKTVKSPKVRETEDA